MKKPAPSPDQPKRIRKNIDLPEELWAEIAEIRFADRIPSEVEAIRRLIQVGIDARKAAISKGTPKR